MLIHRPFVPVLLAVGIWAGAALLSLAAVVFVLVRLPEDYFAAPRRHPLHPLAAVGKNILGVLLVLAGLVLSIPGVPGQGLLTMLIGLLMMDFPGKYRLERMLLGRPAVLSSANRLRERFGRPPFRL